jgi:hypothetical protein
MRKLNCEIEWMFFLHDCELRRYFYIIYYKMVDLLVLTSEKLSEKVCEAKEN